MGCAGGWVVAKATGCVFLVIGNEVFVSLSGRSLSKILPSGRSIDVNLGRVEATAACKALPLALPRFGRRLEIVSDVLRYGIRMRFIIRLIRLSGHGRWHSGRLQRVTGLNEMSQKAHGARFDRGGRQGELPCSHARAIGPPLQLREQSVS